jgi:hypothetical protein
VTNKFDLKINKLKVLEIVYDSLVYDNIEWNALIMREVML